MPITIQCPNPACGAAADVADTFAGRGVKCKKCGTPFKAVPTLDGQRNDTRPSTQPAGDPFASLPAEFGRYRVVKLLGRGGMGAVYLAEDSQLGRPVALKLPSFDASEKKRVERFVREARAAAGLMHPHICPVYDAGQINGRPFITMAYIQGESLEKAIDPDSPMDQRRAAETTRKVALALQEAHEKGIVHRDLKPANVMLNAKGEPVVMDFGLAKRISETDPNEVKLTQQGAVMGTPSYMAPEQVKGDLDRIGPATDVYALGVMLFEMLTGQTPYQGSLGMVMGQILTAAVPPVEEFRPDVDPRLAAVCRTAMAKDPAARFPSMAAVADALAEYLTPTAVSVSLVEMPPPAPVPPPAVVETVNDFAVIDVTNEEPPRPPAPRKRKKAAKPAKPNRAVWIAAAAAGVLALVAVVIVTVRTPHGDVTIELSDPAANVEVKVDGNQITLAKLDKPLTLTAGEHGLTVSGADFETVAQQFTVKKGDKQVVKVSLKAKPKAAASPDPQPTTTTPEAVPQPIVPTTVTAVGGVTGGSSPLFNGKDLTGWKGLTNLWSVKNGAVVGSTYPGGINFNTCLCTDREYGDFELKCKVQLVGGAKANSGIQVRSAIVDADKFIVAGPQCDLGAGYWGSLYGERSGGMMQAANAAAVNVNPTDFNEVLVRCVGKRVTIVLNGGTTVDREFADLPDSGIIGFQLHSGNGLEVTVKDIEFKELTPTATEAGFTQLFNGKDLAGWLVETGNAAIWKVENGTISVNANEVVRAENWLLSEKSYKDFVAKFEFKAEDGTANTGFGFRCVPSERPVVGLNNTPYSVPTHLQLEIFSAQTLVDRTRQLVTGTLLGSLNPQIVSKGDPFGKQKPDGEWNEMEVESRGQSLKVRLNGSSILDANLDDLVKQGGKYPGLRRAEGRIGFQRLRGAAQFRNIRIQELTTPTVSRIPADATALGASAFKVYPDNLSWKDAKAKCEQLGGRLAVIKSDAQNRLASQLIDRASLLEAWIGATDEADEGKWAWIDGTPLTYKNWGPMQPNNKMMAEHFAMIWLGQNRQFKDNGEWSDQPNVSAQHKPGFVCEWAAQAAAVPEAGFTSLFNGKDLAGWTNPAGAQVVADVLEIVPRRGGVRTTGLYGPDVQLKAEFWLPLEANNRGQARANSGIFLLNRYEVQILDSKGFGIEPNKRCGSLYGSVGTTAEAELPPEQWQTLDVTFRAPLATRKGEITVVLNGVTVIDRAAVDRPTVGAVDTVLVPRGPIALQDHGSPVRFRNLRVKELPAAATSDFVSLLNGKDLTGWTTVGAPRWTWANGRVLCSPGGGTGFLMTEAEYDDFELELQYRLGVGAGSGLFLRTDPTGDVSGAKQLEVQIIDDAFPQFAALPAVGKTGSLYNVFARKVDPPIKRGDWNTMRVRVLKRQLQVWVNDVQTIDADLDSAQARDKYAQNPGLVRTTGRIALQQNQRADVEFRAIRLKRLTP